jgi:hypothetical protein
VTEWTSLWPVIPASHSPQQERDSAPMTRATSGLTSPDQYELFAPECVFSRTSKATFPSDSERSLESWNKWVTKCRGEYSVRVKSAHLTRESGSSSWPTIRASEYKDTGPIGSKSHDHMLGKGYLCAVVTQDAANWLTPNCMDVITPTRDLTQVESKGHWGKGMNTGKLSEMVNYGLPAPANPSKDGNRQESLVDWRTPQANEAGARVETLYTKDGQPARPGERAYRKTPDGRMVLQSQTINQQVEMVQNWATPQVKDHKSGHRDATIVQYKQLNVEVEAKATGKLNPRWVETLMGLPIGWTMPSCKMPIVPCGKIMLGQSMEQWPTPSADGDSRPGANADVQKWTKIRDEKKAQGINKQLFLTTKVMMEEQAMRNSASPVTIELTNCDSSATESFLQQQREHSEF